MVKDQHWTKLLLFLKESKLQDKTAARNSCKAREQIQKEAICSSALTLYDYHVYQ